MGFGEGNMAGTDHNFIAKGTANTGIVFTGVDLSHFTPKYFSKRIRWQLPDLEGSVRVNRLKNMAQEQAGCRIINATMDRKLKVFPKIIYSGLCKF